MLHLQSVVSDDEGNSDAVSEEENVEKHQHPKDQSDGVDSDHESVGKEPRPAHRVEQETNTCSQETESSHSENTGPPISREDPAVDSTETETERHNQT